MFSLTIGIIKRTLRCETVCPFQLGMYGDIHIQKSNSFKSLNFIMLQFRTMSLSDSIKRIKGGKNNLGTSFFFSFLLFLQFTSSMVKTCKAEKTQ